MNNKKNKAIQNGFFGGERLAVCQCCRREIPGTLYKLERCIGWPL